MSTVVSNILLFFPKCWQKCKAQFGARKKYTPNLEYWKKLQTLKSLLCYSRKQTAVALEHAGLKTNFVKIMLRTELKIRDSTKTCITTW
jgi:hypothetical protein